MECCSLFGASARHSEASYGEFDRINRLQKSCRSLSVLLNQDEVPIYRAESNAMEAVSWETLDQVVSDKHGCVSFYAKGEKVFETLPSMKLTSDYAITALGIRCCKQDVIPLKLRKLSKEGRKMPYFKAVVYLGKNKPHAYLALASEEEVYTAGYSHEQNRKNKKNNSKIGMLFTPDRCSLFPKKYQVSMKIPLSRAQFENAFDKLKEWKRDTKAGKIPFAALSYNCTTFVTEFAKKHFLYEGEIGRLQSASDAFEGSLEYLFYNSRIKKIIEFVSDAFQSNSIGRVAFRVMKVAFWPMRRIASISFAALINTLSKGSNFGCFSWKKALTGRAEFDSPLELARSLKKA